MKKEGEKGIKEQSKPARSKPVQFLQMGGAVKRESLWVGETIIPDGCEAKEGCMGMEMQEREKGEWALCSVFI